MEGAALRETARKEVGRNVLYRRFFRHFGFHVFEYCT